MSCFISEDLGAASISRVCEVSTKELGYVFNKYEKTEKEMTDGGEVTLFGNGDLYYTVSWNDGTDAYVIYASEGLARDEMLKMASSIYLPKSVE